MSFKSTLVKVKLGLRLIVEKTYSNTTLVKVKLRV